MMNAYRKDGKVIIEFDEFALIAGHHFMMEQYGQGLENPDSYTNEEWLNYVAENFLKIETPYGEDTVINTVLDDLWMHFVEYHIPE